MCVISLSRLLAAPILEATRLGALHAHASLLPDYKGPNPFFWMVKRNERMGGVSLHWMTSVPDAGEVVARRELPLFPGMTAREHDSALAILAAGAFYVALQGLATGELATTPNEATNTPFARNPRGEDLHLDGLPTVEHALWFHEVASAYGTPRLSVTGGPVTRVSRTHFVGSTEFQCRDGIMWGMPA